MLNLIYDSYFLWAHSQLKENYDEIIYADNESIPKKYAILERNKWMVKNSDVIIAYVNKSFGGASKTLQYAKKLKKKFINFG